MELRPDSVSWFPHCGASRSLRYTTVGKTPLDERSARRRDLYLTTHNTHKRQIFMPPAGLEPTIPGNKRLQIHALDCAATDIARYSVCGRNMMCRWLRGFSRRKELVTCCGTVHSIPLLTSNMVTVCVGQKFRE